MSMQTSPHSSVLGFFASAKMQRSPAAAHTPRQNHLLAALPPENYRLLLPALEFITLPRGWTVHGAGDRDNYLYFPTSGIVARICVTQHGPSAAFALTGNEGVIGIASFLGGESALSRAVVLSEGHAYRLKATLLKSECEHAGPLLRLLLRYTLVLIAQTGQTGACNRHHTVEQQLCRWILACLDRLSSNKLTMTQHLIADMLGVRRESVTEAARRLQNAGLIHYTRGNIVVFDRAGVQARACECYTAVKQQYNRLIRPQDACNARVYGSRGISDYQSRRI